MFATLTEYQSIHGKILISFKEFDILVRMI